MKAQVNAARSADLLLPHLDTGCGKLFRIVTGVLGKITLEDGPLNDPDGSCGGVGQRRSLVVKGFRESA